MPERIEFGETLYALIIRADFSDGGIHFFTPHEFSQQLAYMSRPSGYRIQPHYHRKISRQVFLTQEPHAPGRRLRRPPGEHRPASLRVGG